MPYDKGANFLLHIGRCPSSSNDLQDVDSVPGLSERTLGGLDVFLPYAKDYVKTFMGKSITTEMWKEHLFDYYTRFGGDDELEALKSIDWDASIWVILLHITQLMIVNVGLAFWNGRDPSCAHGI